jgi:ssDNA-binding Zn-finger/Zn-ribbon topoisomerase 1
VSLIHFKKDDAMGKDVLIRYAFDDSGRVVNVREVVKGKAYFCPECGERLKFRHGEVRRHHFAHINGGHCTNESTLHAIFKIKAAELFECLLVEGKGFSLSWTCPDCGLRFKGGDLLLSVASVKVEHDLGPCRPDVALLDKEGNPVVAFEVVVTHSPEEQAVSYYKENGIVMVTVDLDRDESLDLNDIDAVIAERSKVFLCCNRVCAGYNTKNTYKSLVKESCVCPQCNRNYEVVVVLHKTPLGAWAFPDLTTEEMTTAEGLFDGNVSLIERKRKLAGRDIVTKRTRCACFPVKKVPTPVRRRPSDPVVNYRGRHMKLSTLKKKYID